MEIIRFVRIHKLKNFFNLFCRVHIDGVSNNIKVLCKIKKGNIRIYGSNNRIKISKSCQFENARIIITGDNNNLIIDEKVRLIGPCVIHLMGNGTLHLRENCGIRGVSFSIVDGKVDIGELCMFSYGITVRNHDSHKVFNLDDPKVANLPKDIILGKHVWVCQNSSILKGVKIGDDSIIAYGAIVTKGCPNNCILAGNPSKIVKENINWDY